MKKIARIHKALSEETRLRLIALLMFGGELCVCDLMVALKLPQSTVSRHLAYLRDSGLVLDRRKGVWMYYKINHEESIGFTIIRNLYEILSNSAQVIKDRQNLKHFLATKAADACTTVTQDHR